MSQVVPELLGIFVLGLLGKSVAVQDMNDLPPPLSSMKGEEASGGQRPSKIVIYHNFSAHFQNFHACIMEPSTYRKKNKKNIYIYILTYLSFVEPFINMNSCSMVYIP